MPEFRPSGNPVIPDAEALVTQELAEIDERGRLHLLPRWARRTNWLPLPPAGNLDALVVLAEPGRLSFLSWEPDGPRIVQRYRDLSMTEDGADFEALRMLQDRYRKLSISTDRRPSLGDAALQHLGLPTTRGLRSNVYVVVMPSRIDVLGPTYRNMRNEGGHPALDGLP
jgi:hypothetical protein